MAPQVRQRARTRRGQSGTKARTAVTTGAAVGSTHRLSTSGLVWATATSGQLRWRHLGAAPPDRHARTGAGLAGCALTVRTQHQRAQPAAVGKGQPHAHPSPTLHGNG